MAPRGYSTRYLVADALGTHDGVVPVLMIDQLIEAAENWIDRRTGRTWLQTTIVGESHTFTRSDRILQLKVYPVVSVSAVRARTLYVGAVTTVLTSVDYELVDLARGQLLLGGTWFGQRLSVDYTANAPVPADIGLAATLLVAAWARPMLGSGSTSSDPTTLRSQGIKSYSIGQDLSVTFQDDGSSSGAGSMTLAAPPEVLRIVNQYRPMSFA